MILDIFASLFFFIIIYLSSIGYGIFFQKNIFGGNFNNSIGETGIFGLFLLCFISVLFHFFIPLNNIFNLIILLIGIILIFYFNELREKYFQLEYLLILLIVIPSLILFEYHADYFWYHLPYVNIANDFKIIFGIANLNDNLGYGHIWYDLLAIFNLPLFETKYISILSILFLCFFLIFLKDNFLNSGQIIIKLFVFFSYCFVCLNYSNSKDFGSEIQGNLIYLIISLYIIKYYLIEDREYKNYLILNTILLFYFAVLIRTNSIIFTPLVFIFLIHNFKYFLKTILNYKLFYSFLLIFSSLYILKNFIVTGCFSYPIYFTCLDFVEWGLGMEQAKLRFYHLSSQSKGYLLYLLNQNFIENIFEYYNYRTNNNFISPEKYLDDHNWLINWWKYEYDINRFLNIIYFFIFSFVLVVLFNFKRIKYSEIITNIKNNFLMITLFALPIFSWLLMLPQTRYGGYAIIFSVSYLVTIIFFYKIKNINLIPFFIILFLSISYFGYKNVDRILNNYNSLVISETDNFYEYPFLGSKQYKINNKFKMSIKERILNDKDILGKPLYCFNLKGLCSSSIRLECIKAINKKNNYIFIISDKKECASIIDRYLWY